MFPSLRLFLSWPSSPSPFHPGFVLLFGECLRTTNLILAQRSSFHGRAPFTVGGFCFGESLVEKRGKRTGEKMGVKESNVFIH